MSPKAIDPVKPIWNAQTMFWSPGPKRMNGAAAIVATQGSTPARRISWRRSTATARCATTTNAW